MADQPFILGDLGTMSVEQVRRAFASLMPENASHEERIAAIASALGSPMGRALRAELGKWIVDNLVPPKYLVPDPYAAWRSPVRDAMLFVFEHLSNARLAPKLLEQIELPPRTPPERRLLQLIAKVPGLQKLGQVLARNRHLRPTLRKALSRLENGIHDVDATTVRRIIHEQLAGQLRKFEVEISPAVLSEASVSAVVRFTWRNPETGKRERGVFKVLKPHIPDCFSEDMTLLQELAHFFGRRHREYGPGARLIPDTFKKARRLLQHEVDFVREQNTLVEAAELYRSFASIRIPRLMRPLCTATITAMSDEAGAKVTDAAARMPSWQRSLLADQLVEALLAVPLFAAGESSLFHADPHAGNLLYDTANRQLVLIDWALRERLSREHRRQLALLFLKVALRDTVGASNAMAALAEKRIRRGSPKARTIRQCVTHFLDELPLKHIPSAVDAMQLMERAAFQGIRFPGPLVMLSKVVFTLDGILADIGGSSSSMGLVMARHIGFRWLTDRKLLASPLTTADWFGLQCSALLYGSRLLVRGEQAIVNRVLPARATAPPATTLAAR